MVRSVLTVVLLSAYVLAPAAGPFRQASPVARAATGPQGVQVASDVLTPVVPTCPFDVGDIVVRGGIGAAVPVRGETVGGYADGPSGGTEITITTTLSGLVTIDPGGELCQLPL